MENIYFHIAAFDVNKVASLRPDILDWGPFSHLVTPEFCHLWKYIFHKIWAQWRWENDDPDYQGPSFSPTAKQPGPPVCEITPGEVNFLQFCGGGKDSLVAIKLLERAELLFDSFTYSSSCYGLAKPQHDLLGMLLKQGTPRAVRRQWIFDDFLDSPVLQLYKDTPTQNLTAAETPSSVFAALPYALQHGYTHLSLGHERSADTGQVFWEKTGEDVNHQWGKSLEAETMLNSYVRKHLVSNLSYFSILKAIYDVLIFNLVRADVELLKYAHSCNIEKPWCKKCPKCAYVWLSYMAWLPTEKVDSVFGNVNLFDLEENQTTFIQLLGQADRLPFECIGQKGETQLAFELCKQKGLQGRAMDRFVELNLNFSADSLLSKYTSYDRTLSAIPPSVWKAIEPKLQLAKDNTLSYAKEILYGSGQSQNLT